MKRKTPQPTCDWCGLYVSWDCREKSGSVDFVPDTHFTRERTEWRCPKCTKEHGPVRAYSGPEFGVM